MIYTKRINEGDIIPFGPLKARIMFMEDEGVDFSFFDQLPDLYKIFEKECLRQCKIELKNRRYEVPSIQASKFESKYELAYKLKDISGIIDRDTGNKYGIEVDFDVTIFASPLSDNFFGTSISTSYFLPGLLTNEIILDVSFDTSGRVISNVSA